MNIYRPAGFWIRLGAVVLDYLITSVPLAIIFMLATGKDPNESTMISIILTLYAILLPVYWNGYVIGKRSAVSASSKRRHSGRLSHYDFESAFGRPDIWRDVWNRRDRERIHGRNERRQTVNPRFCSRNVCHIRAAGRID